MLSYVNVTKKCKIYFQFLNKLYITEYFAYNIWFKKNLKLYFSDTSSWADINKDFFEQYSPLKNKEDNEYWMTLNDFQCNFGGLIICSEADPYHPEGFGLERSYTCKTEKVPDLVYILHSQRRMSERRSSSLKARDHGKMRSYVSEKVKKKVNEIKVTESNLTVKMDTCRRRSTGDATVTSENITHISYPGCISYDHTTEGQLKCQMYTSRKHQSLPHEEIYNSINTRVSFELESSNSTSDISVIISRPHSAPMSSGETDSKYGSSGSVSQLTQSNFLATRKDFFRPRGGWKQIIEQRGCWCSEYEEINMYLLYFIFLTKNVIFSIQSINYLKSLFFIIEANKLWMLFNTSLKCYTFTKVTFFLNPNIFYRKHEWHSTVQSGFAKQVSQNSNNACRKRWRAEAAPI